MSFRAAFDLSTVPHALGGVSGYLLSLASALLESAGEDGWEVVTVDVPAVHPGIAGPAAATVSVPTPAYLKVPLFRRLPIRRGWEEGSRALRIAAASGYPAVYHHGGVQPCCPPGAVSVITVYDLSAMEHPEWHTPGTVEYFRIEEGLLRSGSYACAISGWTAMRLREVLGIPRERILAAGGAAADSFSPGAPSPSVMEIYGLVPGEYMLHVGNFVPRKNIPFLCDCYARSREMGLELPLVFVGAGGWGEEGPSEGEGMSVFRSVPDEHMPHLYRGARVLLLPSECEGLGLPVLEALACGTPVVCSDAAALPETLDGCGRLLPVGDSEAWTTAMERLGDPAEVETLRKMAAKHRRVRWTGIAERVMEFYRRISGE